MYLVIVHTNPFDLLKASFVIEVIKCQHREDWLHEHPIKEANQFKKKNAFCPEYQNSYKHACGSTSPHSFRTFNFNFWDNEFRLN